MVFFIPYLSIMAGNNHSLQDVWSLGKTMFIAMIGTVTLEIGLVSRFWTFPFFAVWLLSFVLAFPWLVLLPLLLLAFGSNDSSLVCLPSLPASLQSRGSGVKQILQHRPSLW